MNEINKSIKNLAKIISFFIFTFTITITSLLTELDTFIKDDEEFILIVILLPTLTITLISILMDKQIHRYNINPFKLRSMVLSEPIVWITITLTTVLVFYKSEIDNFIKF